MAYTPSLPVPPFSDADIAAATDLLRQRVRLSEQSPQLIADDLNAAYYPLVEQQPDEVLGAVIGLWELLTVRLCTPQMAARLPHGPYPGPGNITPWNQAAAEVLPAVVVLAGDDAVHAALHDTLDLATLPDSGYAKAVMTYQAAAAVVAAWNVRRDTNDKEREHLADQIFTAWEPWDTNRWPHLNRDPVWETDLAHEAFLGIAMPDKEIEKFTRVRCPLTITDRYPSELLHGDSRMVGTLSRQGIIATVSRSLWQGALEGVLSYTLGYLTSDLHGYRSTGLGQPLLLPPPQQYTDKPYRAISVALTSGLKFGGLGGGQGQLPGPETAFPADGTLPDGLVEFGVKTAYPDAAITVSLPSKELPTLEDTAVGVMRLLAHSLLNALPELTDHGRTVLTAWRDRGVEPFGPRPGDLTFTQVVDRTVSIVADAGIEWKQDPPAHLLTRT